METQKFAIGAIVVTTKIGYTNSQGTIVDYNAKTKRYRVLWHNDNMRTWVSCAVLTTNLDFVKSKGTGKTKTMISECERMQSQIGKMQKKVTPTCFGVQKILVSSVFLTTVVGLIFQVRSLVF